MDSDNAFDIAVRSVITDFPCVYCVRVRNRCGAEQIIRYSSNRLFGDCFSINILKRRRTRRTHRRGLLFSNTNRVTYVFR